MVSNDDIYDTSRDSEDSEIEYVTDWDMPFFIRTPLWKALFRQAPCSEILIPTGLLDIAGLAFFQVLYDREA